MVENDISKQIYRYMDFVLLQEVHKIYKIS